MSPARIRAGFPCNTLRPINKEKFECVVLP
jgi:hypothetical protein